MTDDNVIKCADCKYLDRRVGYCAECDALVSDAEELSVCEFASKIEATNWDLLRALSADEFSEAFWKILKQSQWYTDSRVWLREWLNAVPANGKLDLRPEWATTFEALNRWERSDTYE